MWTPLHRAAYENRIQVVKLLLEQDAIDVHLRDDHGATALHHAAANGNTEIVNLLIASGADTLVADSDGRTPATYALVNGHRFWISIYLSILINNGEIVGHKRIAILSTKDAHCMAQIMFSVNQYGCPA